MVPQLTTFSTWTPLKRYNHVTAVKNRGPMALPCGTPDTDRCSSVRRSHGDPSGGCPGRGGGQKGAGEGLEGRGPRGTGAGRTGGTARAPVSSTNRPCGGSVMGHVTRDMVSPGGRLSRTLSRGTADAPHYGPHLIIS